MSWTTQLLVPLALTGNGMAAGGMMIAALGGAPLLLRLPDDQYVPIHRFLVSRFDPFMPICLLTGQLASLCLAVVATEAQAQVLCGLAAVLLLSAMVVSLTKNVPINKWVAGLDPERLPPNLPTREQRVRWKNWNLVRTSLVVAALAANAAAVGVLL